MTFKQSFRSLSRARIADSQKGMGSTSIEEEAVHLAASNITAQMLEEGITVDDSVRNEFVAHIREHVSKLIETPHGNSLCKKELAKEALALSNVTSLKLKARKTMKQTKAIMLTTQQPWYIINPIDVRKIAWDIFTVVLLIFSVFEVPFSLAFSADNCRITLIDAMNLFIDCIFCIDCAINLITAYMDKETGILVVDPNRIARRSALCISSSCPPFPLYGHRRWAFSLIRGGGAGISWDGSRATWRRASRWIASCAAQRQAGRDTSVSSRFCGGSRYAGAQSSQSPAPMA